MTIRAGHCSACGTLVWRTAVAQKDWNETKAGQVFLLWPVPESVYARVRDGENLKVGIAYCPACAPPVGTDLWPGQPVQDYEQARERYRAWYDPEKRGFYRAWFADQLWLEPATVDQLMTQWEHDRACQ